MKSPPPLPDLPAAVVPIINAAIGAVRAAAPRADEVACAGQRPRSKSMMWKLLRYRIDDKVVVTIGTFTKHASMFFARGSELDDPSGVLEGKGKSLRYITLRTPADAKRPAVKALPSWSNGHDAALRKRRRGFDSLRGHLDASRPVCSTLRSTSARSSADRAADF